jgi:hypothetical protein
MEVRSMTLRTVLVELIAMVVGYAVGLTVILIVLTDLPAGQIPSLLVGSAIFLVVSVILVTLLTRRLPSLYGRAWRHAIPLVLGFVVAVACLAIPRDAIDPDVSTYVVAVPAFIAGRFVSSLWRSMQ